VPKVQILNPAAGTGAFLLETARQVFEKFSGREGLWQGHVEQCLIPRLNGFEILVEPCTIARLCLGQMLGETGYTPGGRQDFHIRCYQRIIAALDMTGEIMNKMASEE
jgi:hypothetical protein